MRLRPNTYIRGSVSASGWEDIQGLAARAQGGDQASYRLFLKLIAERFRPRIQRLLPSNNVDDAIQELLMAIHKSLHSYDPEKSIVPWLNAIAHYKIQDQLRMVYKTMEQEELSETELENSREDDFSKVDLTRLLKRLSDRELKVVKLLKLEEFSVEEVAQALGISCSNVKVISFRAIGKMRAAMAEEEFYEGN